MLKMRFNFPLKTVMVLTLLTLPTVLPAEKINQRPKMSTMAVTIGAIVATMPTVSIGYGEKKSTRYSRASRNITNRISQMTLEGMRLQGIYNKLSDEDKNRWTDLTYDIETYENRMTEAQLGLDMSRSPVKINDYLAAQAELYQLQNPSKNKIIGIAEDGTLTTIHCNPGPCTMGSVLRHVRISGLPPMVPLTLYNAVIERMAGTLTASESPDEAFALASKLMQTSEVRATDGNAASAYRVPAYTTILAEVSKRREEYENKNVTVQYEPPETTTVTTTVKDDGETEDQRKKREDRAEADRLTQAFEQRLATNIARDAERRAANPGLEVVTPVVTQPTMPTW